MSETRASASGDNEPSSTETVSNDQTYGVRGEPATAAPSPDDHADQRRSQDAKEPEQTLLEQMGGVAGLAYSAVPIVVFVLVNSLAGLMPAIWSAIALALGIGVMRIVRKEPLQPAISGVIGVAVCSFIAYRSGDAKGFFLLGIWTNLIYGGAFLLSILARWPLVGVAWSTLNGLGFAWRQQRRALVGYDVATLAWTLVFGAKFVVQQWLYVSDETGWLAFARIAMGYPLTGLALVVTVWAVRRAAKVAEEAETAATQEGSASLRSNPSMG